MSFSKGDLIFLGAFGVIAVFSIPSCMESQRQWKIVREKYSANQEISQLARVADERYKNGCLPLVRGTHPNLTYAPVVLGQKPSDRHTGNPFPQNTVVCDSNGATGVIDETGAIASVAVTQNRDLVAKRLKRFRGGMYSQPVVEN